MSPSKKKSKNQNNTTNSSGFTAMLIKGYLPVRLSLPNKILQNVSSGGKNNDDNDNDSDNEPTQQYPDETYFFVREHRGKDSTASTIETAEENTTTTTTSTTASKPGCTLFVANAPVVPGISTKLILKSIFGRFAETTRITVIENPRFKKKQEAFEEHLEEDFSSTNNMSSSSIIPWSTKTIHPTFLSTNFSQGKYAHIVFASPKDLKKTLKILQDTMTTTMTVTKNDVTSKKKQQKQQQNNNKPLGLVLEPIEIQTLSDETHRLHNEEIQKLLGKHNEDDSDIDDNVDDDDDDSDNGNDLKNKHKKKTNKSNNTDNGILALVDRYHKSCNRFSRSELLEECNAVIEAYESAEEEKKRIQEAAKAQPDDDGFITVSYSAAVGSKTELDESMDPTSSFSKQIIRRGKGNKRNRGKKKVTTGADELQDFYRFQRRENRKRSLEDLRKQFEEDLRRVKRLKEERQYRPF